MRDPREPNLRQHLWAALVVVLVGLFFVPAQGHCEPDDWPQFRGPNRDGKSGETNLVESFGPDGPKQLWSAEGGKGYSGMSVVDGRLFTLVARGGDELALALDAETGKELWTYRLDDAYRNSFGDGPRSTPTVDGGVVYVLGARAKLAALDAETGEPRWTQDLKKSFGARVPTWGVATSPTVLDDLLLVDVGGRDGASVAALHKRTGLVRWTAGTDIAGYSTPLPITVQGRQQVIFFTGTKIQSVDPKDGTVLWTERWRTEYDVNAAAPVFLPPNRLFVSSGYDTGAAVYEIEVEGRDVSAREVWSSRGMKNQFSSSIYLDGHIYGFDNSILKCIDPKTGEDVWRARGYGHGSMTYADGKLILLSDRGKLGWVEPSPEELRELDTAQIFHSKTWTVPTLADGVLYVRDESRILALDVKGQEGA